jgi:hypothetical protein
MVGDCRHQFAAVVFRDGGRDHQLVAKLARSQICAANDLGVKLAVQVGENES